MSCSEFHCDDRERVQHLLASRDSLSLKVAMLTKQVAFQREKIHEMETMLNSRHNDGVNNKQNSNESMEPIAQELANLQHKNLVLEREKLEAERRLRLSNSELEHYVSEQSSLSKTQRTKNCNDTSVNQAELERLQLAIQRLLADNEQKHYQQSFPAFMPMSNSFSFSPGSQQQQQIVAYTPPLWRVSSPPTIPPHLGHSSKPQASPMARKLAAELDELRRSGALLSSGGIHHHPQYSSSSLPRSIHSK
uniref:Liprin-beta-1/2 coiled-coil domain-containing protein n=1 Tax=Meloidogyne javanica TaxID=6303 RepID=A0A915MXX9_MELJA